MSLNLQLECGDVEKLDNGCPGLSGAEKETWVWGLAPSRLQSDPASGCFQLLSIEHPVGAQHCTWCKGMSVGFSIATREKKNKTKLKLLFVSVKPKVLLKPLAPFLACSNIEQYWTGRS